MPDVEHLTQIELAGRLEITTRQIQHLTKEGPLGAIRSPGVRGRYRWPVAQELHRAFREEAAARRRPAGGRPANAQRVFKVMDDFERAGLLEDLLEGVSARLGVTLK